MLLDDLVAVIETLKERIATHGPALRENETRTRMALIDPLLQALGWDTSDPSMVLPEFDVSGRKADYALLGGDGRPSATMEAKKLGEPLTSHRMQMLNYSNASGVEYAGLTDGDKWELYEVFKRGQLDERRILDVSIANTPVHEAALKLLLLWRPNLASGQPVAASEPAFSQITHEQPFAASHSSEPEPVLPDDVGNWISLANFQPGKESRRPVAIRFLSGEVRPLNRWLDILVELLEHLIIKGRFSVRNCPWVSGRGGVKVNTTPNDGNGRAFASPKELTGGLYVETHGNRNAIIRRCLNLANSLDINPATVELRLD